MKYRILSFLLALCILAGCAAQKQTNTNSQNSLDCSPEGILKVSMEELTVEKLESALQEQGWKSYGDHIWLGESWEEPLALALILDETESTVRSLRWFKMYYPEANEASVQNSLEQMAEDEFSDFRASVPYANGCETVMAAWILQAREIMNAAGGTLQEKSMRLTAEDQESLEAFFAQRLADKSYMSVVYGEQYAVLPDGSYLSYCVYVSQGTGGVNVQMTRYAADYQPITADEQPLQMDYDPCEDYPLSYLRIPADTQDTQTSEQTDENQEPLDCTLESLLATPLEELSEERLTAAFTALGWKSYQIPGGSSWLAEEWGSPVLLTFAVDEASGAITMLLWSRMLYPSSLEQDAQTALENLPDDQWRDIRAASFYEEETVTVQSLMADWILMGREQRQKLGGELLEGAMRLTAEDQAGLEELIRQKLSEEGVNGAEYGEQYAVLSDGTYLGYSASCNSSGVVTQRIVRYAADYKTSMGGMPQYSYYDNYEDTPLSVG